ncbi:MAG TPA: SMI1/KNR4 family protein [Methanosarcina vacuolata]|nr:SMI1/KNR4 family protein [Methanosarcina vacuolata]
MTLIDEAIEGLKAKSIQKPDIVPPPTPAQIADAEAKLGCKFPPSFLAFLNQAGSYQLRYWETFWVGDESLRYRNIVEANRSEREESDPALPDFLITFHNNGCGDQLCFDTRKPGNDGEYPIVFWDHEGTAEENLESLSPVADNFADWLMQEVKAKS